MILVSVLVLVVLGVVGLSRMTTDFLPKMNLPYMMVMTTYPGASPQKVEAEVTDLIENGVGTINGIKNVNSNSAENVSQVFLEFEDDTDMDSAMVKVTSAVNQMEFPDSVSKPVVMEISMDMLPVAYVSVDVDGKKGNELTKFINDNVIPELKRQEGVASIQSAGLIEDSIQVKLNKTKINDINERIYAVADSKLSEAREELDSAQAQLNKAKSQIKKQQKKLAKEQKKQTGELAKYSKLMNQAMANQAAYDSQYQSLLAYQKALEAQKSAYEQITGPMAEMVKPQLEEVTKELERVKTQAAVAKAASDTVNKQVSKATKNYEKVEAGKITASAAFGSGAAQLAQAQSSLESSQAELDSGYESYEKSREEALKNANANQLLSLDTLAGIITAENFSMPAGYIKSGKKQYLLKVGEETASQEEIEDMVLAHIDGVGDISVLDVADVKLVNNENETYARVNGNDAAVLAIYKSSLAGTSEVSDTLKEALQRLEEENEGLHFISLMDQGDYIDIIIKSVFSNLITGAILAILVLLLFLRNLRPTSIVALSIPLSVLFALLLMYFGNISLNIISLSGLALGIGMLVDNSIVVMENIYRLRARGISAARAAVMGANQVAGAIAASTLTTICVFVPVLFTDGLTRQLMQDMCLTITFSLLASLAVALTVVPAFSATVLRNTEPKRDLWIEWLQVRYEKALDFCLRRKFVPILLAIVLLGVCAAKVVSTGIIIIPEMGSTQMSMQMQASDETSQKEDYALMDDISQQVSKIKGVDTVGAIQSTTLGFSAGGANKNYTAMILLEEDYANKNKQVAKKVEKILEKANLKDYTVADSNMDTSELLGSGLQVDIYGDDDDKLLDISKDIMKMVEDVKGFEEISNGQEAADQEIVLDIDKTKAMRKGLTVAQIYQALQTKLTDEKNATQIDVEDGTLNVNLKDSREPLTKKNLLKFKIESTVTNADGTQETKEYKLGDFADYHIRDSVASIAHDNGSKVMSVTATVKDGYNTTLQSRKLEKMLAKYDTPKGYKVEITGETESVNKMVHDMLLMMLVAAILIYLIMVAQFSNFLSPFIVMFTIPLAFTGGFLALMATGEELSMIAMMGFLILSGVVVNNGIVFIDYANQLRRDGMEKRAALIETGKSRMRPILMTALTTILAMCVMAVSQGQGAEMGRGMAIVTIGGLAYATLMTLFIVPVLYDIFYRKKDMKAVDLGDESTLNAKEGFEE